MWEFLLFFNNSELPIRICWNGCHIKAPWFYFQSNGLSCQIRRLGVWAARCHWRSLVDSWILDSLVWSEPCARSILGVKADKISVGISKEVVQDHGLATLDIDGDL